MTPIRRQYLQIKKQYPEAIVFFRLGDFYETFDEDAKTTARELEIVLTSREMGKGQRVPMAGIPYHALEGYLARLIKKGYKVAICEQLGDPATSKGIVERDVVRVVTPGTVIEPSLLEEKSNNYLAALVVEDGECGIAFVDITTSEFATAQVSFPSLSLELERISPSELLIPKGQEVLNLAASYHPSYLGPQAFDLEEARETLLEHFSVLTLEAYGCEGLPLAIRAAGAIIGYLKETQKAGLGQITALHTYNPHSYMTLDGQTRRNLELFQSSRFGRDGLSLLAVLDMTKTPMGGRLIRRWLGQPLLDVAMINERQEGVAWFVEHPMQRQRVSVSLARIADIERLLNRIGGGSASPRDVVALARSLEVVPSLNELLSQAPSWLRSGLKGCEDVVALVNGALAEEPRGIPGEGGVIKEGFSLELDALRSASRNAKDFIAGLEEKEREQTGIRLLKVGYNRVFGYYLEVTNPHLNLVPSHYIRRQTLVGGERFITPELKEYEAITLNAQERIGEMESALFRQVCRQVGESAPSITSTSEAVAKIDVLWALGEVASRYSYVRPEINEGETIEIKGGRHPVVERAIPAGTFTPNETHLSNDDAQLILLTGPNMSGKSTYLRQVALIVLMAQIGSFVPADSAVIGMVDRVFTRIGLQDDLVTGHSTFMVEMVETAQILHHATSRSLIILDEIGRGTSTYDGLAIAKAVAEYIHNHPGLGCKTLFATHYHELTGLASYLPRVKSYSVAVSEEGGKVVFLHHIVPGAADKSYGVHVAQLAGLPKAVLNRASELLREMEAEGSSRTVRMANSTQKRGGPVEQLPLFIDNRHGVVQELKGLDLNSMTPLDALNKLYELQRKAGERGGK